MPRTYTPEQLAAKIEYNRKWRAENPDKVKQQERRNNAKRLADPEFAAKNAARVSAWQKANPGKVAARNKAWRDAHKEELAAKQAARRATDESRAYMRQYQRTRSGMLDAPAETRGGVCAICGDTHEQLVLDHWHDGPKRGLIRDWLCQACNKSLGGFKDSPARLRAAAAYIERHAAGGQQAEPVT